MAEYLGDYPTGHTAVTIPFDSFAAATGASSATSNFAAADVQIYKDGGTTQRSSSAGITVSTSFDSQTGLQMILIDLSDNTDAGFYAAGHEYDVAVADITVDGQTLRFWAGKFSIERAGGALALVKAGVSLAAAYDFAKGTVAVTESYAANGVAPTPVQAMMAMHQMLMDFGISGTSLTVKKLNNSTTAFVVTLNDAATPTAAART